MKISRRHFITSTGAGAAALLAGCGKRERPIPGSIVGASSAAGHRLRDGKFPEPAETLKTGVVIAGGGVAGLSAARRLEKRGVRDFLLLDLEQQTGGNAACGRNDVSAYPWGAHYVPLVNEEAGEVMALFEELGIIRGRDAGGTPIYDEESLCSDPMERLFDCGQWQEGFVPQIGVSDSDRRDYDCFFAAMERFRKMQGSDGRHAFAIPIDLSSRDPQLLALDRMTMQEWMNQQGWKSEPLRWYVDYCCRDDYGGGYDRTSAWAGIHYFASRRGKAANAERDSVVTWPEGNGWLARRLTEPLKDRVRTGTIAWNIENNGRGVIVDCFDLARERSIRIEARAAVCAMPRFVARRVVRDLREGQAGTGGEYSPWMVANVTLDDIPNGYGVSLSWDNVWRGSRSLGYVVATHQGTSLVPLRTVLTHYWPLDDQPPSAARQIAIARSHAEWCAIILADLERVHPDIAAHVRNIDVWLWGHGMIRPVPGYIWGSARQQMREPCGRVFFAHSDMSGISIFEEAFTRGVEAADALLACPA